MITLYQHQQRIVDDFKPKLLIAHGLGTGKTITALALAKKAHVPTLVICPKMLKPKWKRETNEWLGDMRPHLPLGESHHLVLTKEEFKRDYKIIGKYDAIIVDEAHNTFGSLKAQGHKALMLYIKVHNPTYIWLLTGTPYTSTPFSIYALARILGHKWNWLDFRDKYFREKYLGKRVIFEPRAGIEHEIADLVRQIGSVVRLDECIDVPVQSFAEEKFTYTKEQLAEIVSLKDRVSNPLTRFGKMHQIAQGILIGDEYTADKTFPAKKNDRIMELAEENEKMIVFSRYNKHLDFLFDMLIEKDIPCMIINGATKDRDDKIRLAETSKRIVLLIQADCAEGYELPSFSIVVHASHTYSFVKYNQSCGRVLRINAPKPNYYLSLVTEGSADEPVMQAMQRKEDFHEEIFIKTNPSLF